MTVTVANWTAFSCCSSAAWSRGSSPATGGTTAATSVPIDRSSSTAVPTAATGSSAFLVSTTTTSGPLLPAPKFSEIRSYATRLSLPAGAVPLSGSASSIEATGIEITAAAARPTTRAGTLNRVTSSTQRRPLLRPSSPSGSRFFRNFTFPADTRLPAKPSSAGRRVRAIRTAIATVAAPPRPIWVRNPMPVTESPTRAMITVRPAKTTAEPAVPTATPAASSGGRPLLTSCW